MRLANNQLSEYDYHLPPALIAQQPAHPRDEARLLVLKKKTGEIFHRRFFDLPDLLNGGTVLVFNDSKVIPARLYGRKPTGGRVEIFLLSKKSGRKNIWQCLVGGKVKPEQVISFNKKVSGRIIGRVDEKTWLIEFTVSDQKLFLLGQTPLPPYIKRLAALKDYQTVFAKVAGSVAAPTAGLHFTKRLLHRLKQEGAQIEFVTLHVGLGTFLPVETEDISKHKMHKELGEINPLTAWRLNEAKRAGKKIIAVGTTTCRLLESCTEQKGIIKPQKTGTDIFIYPGYRFKFVDGLITNFHLPKSTLLMLVAALAGKNKIDAAYREAIRKKYRFYSFGDGMMII